MTHPTPRFTGRNGTRNYIAYIVADAEWAVQQAKAEGQLLRGEHGTEQQRIAEAWARAAELRAAGLEFEAEFVAQQAREMEAGI